MNRLLSTMLAAGLAVAACKPKPQPTPPPSTDAEQAEPAPPLSEAVDTVFAAWFRARPVTATTIGEHAHDARWPDLTDAGIAADLERIEAGIALLQRVAAVELPVDDRVDLEILQSELARQAFEHEVEKPWRRDPMWYAQLVGTGIDDLVSREFAPVAERAASVAARLETLPALVDQAFTNLDPERCLPPQTNVALGQLDGVVVLIEQVVPERLSEAPADVRTRIEAARPAAVAAVQKLRDHIDTEIRPVAAGQWRLGKDAFQRKLELTLQTKLSAEELRRVAEAEHERVRKRMAQLAYELAAVLFRSGAIQRIRDKAAGDPDTALVQAVLNTLAENHVQPDELRDAIEANLTRLTAFVGEKNIVPMDDAEVLEVIWTPPHQRGVFIAGLAAPGPLDAAKSGLPSFYLVQPVPETWPEAQRESFLREYNNFMLEILSIHEAIPGHFVQLYYAKRHPSVVRKVLANGPFVEGWAVYAEKVMVDRGYAGTGPDPDARRPRGLDRRVWAVMKDPTQRAKAIALHGLKFYLRTVTNAILDHAIHVDGMSEQEALDLMIERSFQQQGEARGKWVRAQVTSTQLSTYFVGAQAWLRLRKKAELRARDRNETFDMATFHEAALSHGAPPVHTLPALMGWDPAPQPASTDTEASDAGPTPAPDGPPPEAASSTPHP